MGATSVRLQPEIEKGLEELADKVRRSKSWLVNQAIREFLERAEKEQARWRETLQAMESAARGKIVAGEDVHSWLRSWGAADESGPPEPDQ